MGAVMNFRVWLPRESVSFSFTPWARADSEASTNWGSMVRALAVMISFMSGYLSARAWMLPLWSGSRCCTTR